MVLREGAKGGTKILAGLSHKHFGRPYNNQRVHTNNKKHGRTDNEAKQHTRAFVFIFPSSHYQLKTWLRPMCDAASVHQAPAYSSLP